LELRKVIRIFETVMGIVKKLFVNEVDVQKKKGVRACRKASHLYTRIKKSSTDTGFKKWLCAYCGKIIESS
jgi:hypothetical protein